MGCLSARSTCRSSPSNCRVNSYRHCLYITYTFDGGPECISALLDTWNRVEDERFAEPPGLSQRGYNNMCGRLEINVKTKRSSNSGASLIAKYRPWSDSFHVGIEPQLSTLFTALCVRAHRI